MGGIVGVRRRVHFILLQALGPNQKSSSQGHSWGSACCKVTQPQALERTGLSCLCFVVFINIMFQSNFTIDTIKKEITLLLLLTTNYYYYYYYYYYY